MPDLKAEVPLDMEMQGGLTTWDCLTHVFQLHLALFCFSIYLGMLPTCSFPWVLKDKERRDRWWGDAPGVLVHLRMLGAQQHSWEQADPKVVFMLPLHLPSYGGKVEKAMKGRNMSHWRLKL